MIFLSRAGSVFLLLVPTTGAFAPFSSWNRFHYNAVVTHSTDPGQEEPGEGLIVGEEVASHMQKIKTKYPTSESDYLAAARARNAAKTASSPRGANDEDWQKISREKQEQMEQMEAAGIDVDIDLEDVFEEVTKSKMGDSDIYVEGEGDDNLLLF